jgi:hypothetical protein
VDCERVYLLGDVAVRLDGDEAVLGRGVRHLRWGDWVGQGLPFFCGNVTYRVVLAGDGGVHRLRAEGFAAPLLRVAVDGRDAGVIAWGPWTCDLGRLDPGPHELAITAFGHRRNGFGPVHLARDLPWVGPNAWRTQGADWCDGYRLRPTGILAPPILERLG